VFTLEFEDTYRILLVRFSGVLVSEDICQIDEVVTQAIAWGGRLHGLLLDFSSVQAVGIPETFVALRASLPLISPDCERAFVVPSAELRELAQTYAALQRTYGAKAPHVVDSMSDACEVLQLDRPNFRPLGT
jgi:hypothetical protein